MSKIYGLTEMQRRILMVLEEAGEEHVSALLNTVKSCEGDPIEVDDLIISLQELAERRLIAVAQEHRNAHSMQLQPASLDVSLSKISTLRTSLNWSAKESIWKWHSSTNCLDIVLTLSGMEAAHEVLAEYGWWEGYA